MAKDSSILNASPIRKSGHKRTSSLKKIVDWIKDHQHQDTNEEAQGQSSKQETMRKQIGYLYGHGPGSDDQ
ncbi:MAG: hypothetical protein M1820_007508 [Bogoriella megaspora]|nr:MAG: hypothetical protein M1820_007508 [Bogoriella megaspora]